MVECESLGARSTHYRICYSKEEGELSDLVGSLAPLWVVGRTLPYVAVEGFDLFEMVVGALSSGAVVVAVPLRNFPLSFHGLDFHSGYVEASRYV